MAENVAGRLFIELLPDVDKKKFQAAIDTSVTGTSATVPATLKLTKSAVTEVITEANEKLAARTSKPVLRVDLKVNKASITPLIADANAALAARSVRPKMKVDLELGKGTAGKAAAQAKSVSDQVELYEKKLTAKINREHLNRDKLAAIHSAKQGATYAAQHKYMNQIAESSAMKRSAVLVAEAGRAAEIEAVAQARRAGALNAAVSRGLDQRSLIELRAAKQRELINLRAENRINTSRSTSLRTVRNDLSSLDASTTRVLRRMSLGFGLFTAGVVTSFAAISVKALKSFADTEVQVKRTAAVLGSTVFSKTGGTNAEKWEAFHKAVKDVNGELEKAVNTAALKTTFDPTETARGARALAQAGGELKDIQTSLLGIAQFAQNEEILPEEAVQQLVQGATTAGLGLDKITGLADRFTFVANNTTASAKEIADAFANRAAPAFRAYGQSVDQTLTVLDLFAAAGIKGKTAGEQTGILIREIVKASQKTPDTIAAFKKYGIQVGRVNGKNIEFTTTLSQLAAQFEKVRKEKGSQGLARLRKELGLTEKSGAGLIQILPQISKLGLPGIQKLTAQIKGSGGAVAQQAKAITNTLPFQFEQFTNQVGALFKTASGPLGKGLTKIFRGLNGELDKTSGITGRLEQAFAATGEKIAKSLIPSLRRFAFGGEGEAFIVGLKNLYAGTLIGLRQSFIEFRRAAFGDAEGRGFFSLLGAAFGAIGRFSRTTLPRIGAAFGTITRFISENKTVVKALIGVWIGTFIFSRTLRLAIIPATDLVERMKDLNKVIKLIAASSFVSWLTGSITGMNNLKRATQGATAATEALAIAQAGANAVSIAKVPKAAAIPVSKASTATAATTSATAGAASLTKVEASASRTSIAFAKLGASIKFAAKSFIPLTFFAGVFKGIFDGISLALGGDGKVTLRDFGNALSSVGHAISSIINPIVTVIGYLTSVVFWFGKLVGAVVGEAVVDVIRSVGDAFQYLGGKIDDFLDKTPRAKNALVNFASNLQIGPFNTRSFIDAANGFKAIRSEVDSANTSLLRIQLGETFKKLSEDSRELDGSATVASKTWKELSDKLLAKKIANEKRLTQEAQNAVNRRIAIRGRETIQAALDLQKRIKETNVLGVANDTLLPKYIRLTAAQRAYGVTTEQAAKRATNYQRRQAYLAMVTDVLTGKLRNQSIMQQILGSASTNAGTNLLRMAGGSKGLEALMIRVADGNKKAAKTFLTIARNAALAAAAVVKAKAQIAQQELDKINAEAVGIPSAAVTESPYVKGLQSQIAAGARADAVAKRNIKQNQALVKELQKSTGDGAGTVLDNITGDTDKASGAINELKSSANQAAEAVNRLSQAQLDKEAAAIVAKVTRNAAKGYQATAHEAEILRRVLPAVEEQLQRQQDAVSKLDEALQNLQQTQIKGTQAFSDQAFAIEQSIKKIQLQRLDLIIAGTPEEDAAIKALDEQINQLQQKSERLSLVESLQLDPLRRKLEQAFNPVKELSFDQIMKQFQSLSKQKAPLVKAIAGGEQLKATLEATIKEADAKFGEAGRQVTAGFAQGIINNNPMVINAGRASGRAALAGVNSVMQFGSPSRTMIQRGLWIISGLVNGMNQNRESVRRSGIQTMFGFLRGMQNVFDNRVKPFIASIAAWIKDNKGPVAYDATLLRPAGEAMMKGFHRGLKDGFNEVKTWVSDVGPDLARHTIPDKIFKKMSAEFIIGNATADMKFDPGEFFSSIAPMGEVGSAEGFLGQSTSLAETIRQARLIAQMFGITPNIASENLRYNNHAYNASIGGAANSLHIFGRAMDFSGMNSRLTDAANWARQYMDLVFDEVLWQTTGHYDHLHLGWKYGTARLIADIGGASRVVEEALANAANLTGVDFDLLAAIAKAESGFNPNSVSPVGAGGLMQLMPGTARSLGVNNVFDPKQNALGGAKYIKNMLETFNNNMRLALAGYNAGPGNAAVALRSFSETIAYVERVMRYFQQFNSGNYRAQGGKVNAMTPYIVGERGQEMFIPSRNGSVVSNRDLRNLIDALNSSQQAGAGMAGTTINDNRRFEVISNSNDPATVAALVDARIRSQVVGVRR